MIEQGKGLFSFSTLVFIFSFCIILSAFVSIANASFIEVSEELFISGNGSFERDFEAQSAPEYTGQKLIESIVPVSLPHGNSTSYYESNFELLLCNNSSIYFESTSDLFEVKHYQFNQNYELGVVTGFQFIGSQRKTVSFESSPWVSEAIVKSEAEGRSVLCARVVNKTHHHKRTIDSLTWLVGNYTLDWNFLVLDTECPEEGEDDWLPCP